MASDMQILSGIPAPLSAETTRRAVEFVAKCAHDEADRAMLLDMLGLPDDS